ncbi:MAG: hypothetical protein RR436_05935, partial [Clostridia bacterium]
MTKQEIKTILQLNKFIYKTNLKERRINMKVSNEKPNETDEVLSKKTFSKKNISKKTFSRKNIIIVVLSVVILLAVVITSVVLVYGKSKESNK